MHITEYELNKLNNMNNKIPYLKDYEGGSIEDNGRFDITNNDVRDRLKLCYVSTVVEHYENPVHLCFFTEDSLDDVWGDDWDDAPYEHNAGTPYAPCLTLFAIGVDSARSGYLNSPYTVEGINNGEVPWLTDEGNNGLYAGATVNEFIQFMVDSPSGIYL